MAIMKIAAGLAVGYVLGARAGRERYEQIAASARRVGGLPAVQQAQEKTKDVVRTGAEAATAKVRESVTKAGETSPGVTRPRRPRHRPSPADLKPAPAAGEPLS